MEVFGLQQADALAWCFRKHTQKSAFKACKDNKPWGPSQPEAEGDMWPVDERLHNRYTDRGERNG